MKSKWTCAGAATFFAVAVAIAAATQYRVALPGYRYEFPHDHFNHPQFQTEWWYYTGNMKSADGHRFGFELTFFRQGVNPASATTDAWEVRDLYLAHLALSDLDGGKFFPAERTNRAGPGIAGISEAERRIWNGNWQITWRGEEQILQAIDERLALHLTLRSVKAPVIHGENGVSQKAEGPGHASHYISLTRLNARGQVQMGGKTYEVTGTAWMDHEFFTHQLTAVQVGWDWMSIQLEDNSELMLFHIRREDGAIDPYSAGTFVDPHGNSTHLRGNEFRLEAAGAVWASRSTHAVYPVQWKISVPRFGIVLESSTSLRSQELTSSSGFLPAYWEGAIALAGERNGSPVGGVGYLEMTGYDHPIEVLR
jgi:predicted secreted hydrolase